MRHAFYLRKRRARTPKMGLKARPLGLAQTCGLAGLLAELVRIGTSIGSNPAGKISAIVAGMVTGADCIDDLDVVRHGGMPALFGECY
ncbi:MAG: hypothetical protein LC808_42645, partial [Actinobacteria bacterium]|nr:hypothetical protein [Actinomycetota bacterium]